jgi:hypothetical protein
VSVTDPFERRCGSCSAYKKMGTHPEKGAVGACAREIYPYPVLPSSTCSEYRARGLPLAPLPVRKGTSPRPSAVRAVAPFVRKPERPSEIDIDMDMETFRAVLTEVLREELGVGEATLGGRWQGGEIILRPGKEGTAEKRLSIESFFHKVVMLRDRLRVLEQRINAHTGLTDEDKVAMQQYVTACYGSLTTFNVLFADPKNEGFRGAGGKDE